MSFKQKELPDLSKEKIIYFESGDVKARLSVTIEKKLSCAVINSFSSDKKNLSFNNLIGFCVELLKLLEQSKLLSFCFDPLNAEIGQIAQKFGLAYGKKSESANPEAYKEYPTYIHMSTSELKEKIGTRINKN